MNYQNILVEVQQVWWSMTMTKTFGQHDFFMDYIKELMTSMEIYMPITGVNVQPWEESYLQTFQVIDFCLKVRLILCSNQSPSMFHIHVVWEMVMVILMNGLTQAEKV